MITPTPASAAAHRRLLDEAQNGRFEVLGDALRIGTLGDESTIAARRSARLGDLSLDDLGIDPTTSALTSASAAVALP